MKTLKQYLDEANVKPSGKLYQKVEHLTESAEATFRNLSNRERATLKRLVSSSDYKDIGGPISEKEMNQGIHERKERWNPTLKKWEYV